ncbi:MAG: 30S ribosomal protein S9 [Candidatus Levyibacteriota bacterium]
MAKTEEKKEEQIEEPKNIKKSKKDYIASVGRRKNAVARVRLYKNLSEELFFGEQKVEEGKVYVNKMPIEKYFGGQVQMASYMEPFKATDTLDKYTITIVVSGGGKEGQLDAVIHGLARALSTLDREKHRKVLKKKGMLTRDSRIRERRKVGTGGKARRAKQSPKR